MKSNSLRKSFRAKSRRRPTLLLHRFGRSRRGPALEYLEPRQLLAVGDLDPTFGNAGKALFPFQLGGDNTNYAKAVAVDGKGRIIAVGPIERGPGNTDVGIVRLNPDGTPDKTFGPNKNGSVVIAGDFGPVGNRNDAPTAVAIDSSNRIVIAGYTEVGTGIYEFALSRLDENGNLDKTFGGEDFAPLGEEGIPFNNGAGDTDDRVNAIAINDFGEIIVAGTVEDATGAKEFGIAALDSNGHVDTTFGHQGKQVVSFGDRDEGANAVAIDPVTNNIVVAGYTHHAGKSEFVVAKLLRSGALDSSFINGGKSFMPFSSGDAEATSVDVDKQGRIIVAGKVVTSTGHGSVAMARITSDGKFFDGAFNGTGQKVFDFGTGTFSEAYSVIVDQGGRLVVSGYVIQGSSVLATVARLKDNGSYDTTFAGDGLQTFQFDAGNQTSVVLAAAIDNRGQLVVAGLGGGTAPASDFAFARIIMNRAPVATDDVYVVTPSGSTPISVDAAHGAFFNDSDPDGDTFSGASVTDAKYGTLNAFGDGSFNYTPGPSFPGFERVTYTIADRYLTSNAAASAILSRTGAIVWKFYESMLDRAPDDQGLAYWIHAFNSGVALSQIAVNFFAGDELQTRVITDYYLQYLGRGPDQGGLAYWKEQWNAAGGPEDVQAGFANSPEFTKQNGNTPAGWVTGLYLKILNRQPEASGLNYWVTQVQNLAALDGQTFVADAGAREKVALSILKSKEEYEAIIVPGWFAQFVQRQPTATELAKYVDELLSGTPDRTVEEEIIDQAGVTANVPNPTAGTAIRLPNFYYVPLVEQSHASAQDSVAATDAIFADLNG